MDIRNVGVVVDGIIYHKSDVIKVIKEEGYKHNFVFLNGVKDLVKYMNQCDEIWEFSNCDNTLEHKIAIELVKDIWKMG